MSRFTEFRRICHGKLRCRNAELAVHRGNPQIGLHRDRQPAAQAEAADARDDRLGKRGILRPPHARLPIVLLLCIGVRAVLLELTDVGTGNECLVARAGKDHHAHGRILGEIVEDFTEAGPHLQ